MHKITSINLNGKAYQFEQAAYEALHEYLTKAQTKLADDPDKDEVLQDFEQAIAEKCDQVLTAHKNVVTAAEINIIIESMGPVETPEAASDGRAKTHRVTTEQAPKRLYTLKEGAVIGGVCNGLATYLNIDVTIMRIIFAVLAFATSGFWILVYFIMMVIVPEAKTPEQKAELRGERFTAADLLDRAKQKYSEVSKEKPWEPMAKNTAPALSELGEVLLKVFRVLSTIAGVAIALLLAIGAAAWIALTWTLLFRDVSFPAELATISHAAVAGAATAAYVLLGVPLWFAMSFLLRFGKNSTTKVTPGQAIAGIVLWIAAFTVIMCTIAVNGGRLDAYQQSHHTHWNSDTHDSICIDRDCHRIHPLAQ